MALAKEIRSSWSSNSLCRGRTTSFRARANTRNFGADTVLTKLFSVTLDLKTRHSTINMLLLRGLKDRSKRQYLFGVAEITLAVPPLVYYTNKTVYQRNDHLPLGAFFLEHQDCSYCK